ncbi:hypothetical protein NEPAR06_0498 [Nematocida parisii]|uniref:Uncharacterized protein n=1 Tax=Nematocida parisii (strain ERTm3) TaxID=935791 RepID=I3EJF7_NEMP3|nr:uncharacterized protein NEPG_01115 [Nematocida parisii ERTm1]EIJ89354.1 hypothetical protein NEQG_00124 [Nematocida parisii ERTm3]KAI5127442.1 hypothetical protein NEPAR08_0883 [Nematocida parisii]EIJ94447.1 hypothetical protein NEPG_01115 [Nematocida parisii ERTm1]KAI5129041.1 hypothetical protein NEPAR03_1487 [Nematocida parisii]KAI5141315.1 hypothetical protein NEPAR04_0877 [Nematocida parisii]|eukprot:XP_013058943.1 hypothetical protein NEPG_01115 [Nematocida parisii ERTm1]
MKLTEQCPFLILLLITHILHINITYTTADNQTTRTDLNSHCVINNEHTPNLSTQSPLSNTTYNTSSKNTSEYSNVGILYITYITKEHPAHENLITITTSDTNALSNINIIPRIYNEPECPTSQLSITAENNLVILDFNGTVFITSVMHNLLPITQYIPSHTAQYVISNNSPPLDTTQYIINNNHPSNFNPNQIVMGWNAPEPDLTRNPLFYDHSVINNDPNCTAINPLNMTQSPQSNAPIMRMPLLPTPYTQYSKCTPNIITNPNGMPPCIPGHNFIPLPGNNTPRFTRHRSINKKQKSKNSSELNTQCVKSSAYSPTNPKPVPDENHTTNTPPDTRTTGVPPTWKNNSNNTVKWDSLD